MNVIRWCPLVLLLIGAAFARGEEPAGPADDAEPVDLVRPWIGSNDARWFHGNSACRPFGMINLLPDTSYEKRYARVGYVLFARQAKLWRRRSLSPPLHRTSQSGRGDVK